MTNYPQNPNVGDEFDTGTVTFMWDGVKWKAVTVGGRTIISYANTESMQNSRPTQTGQRAEVVALDNAQFIVADPGYIAEDGDIVTANGRVWKRLYKDFIIYGPDQFEDQGDAQRGPIIRRRSTTTEVLEIFVDASAESGGDGSQSSPYTSINRALEDVPREIYHKVRIYLTDGVYDGQENAWNLYNYFVTPRSTAGFQIIGHVPENPLYSDTDISAVVLGGASTSSPVDNFVIGGVTGDADDTKMIGVTIDGRVQVYGCPYAFDRVNFKTGKNGFLIGGHSGRIKLTTCDFSNCEAILNAIDLAHFYVTNCTASNITSNSAVVKNASVVMFESSSPVAFIRPIDQEGNCIVKVDGGYISSGSGVNSWGVNSSDGGQSLISTNNDGDVIAKQALVGGAGVVTIPQDKFSFYVNPNQDGIFIKMNVGGVEKIVQLYDFSTNTIL